MRSTFFPLVLMVANIFACGQLQAQSASDEFELQTFIRHFMTTYNQHDPTGLGSMFTEDGVLLDATGRETSGADQIADHFRQEFVKNNTTLLLRPSNISWSDAEHAFIVSGTFEIFGNTNVYDIQINDAGAFTNTMIKLNGEWRIVRSELSPTVKVMVYHQVRDFMEWKSVFDREKPRRMAAGELRAEIGRLHDDPKTAYVVSEWKSLAHFQRYFAEPDLEKSMQGAGVIGKPNVLLLDKQKKR